VLSVVVGGEFDNASVNYRLRNRSGRWLVIDVMVEGISFVSNYRDQFREVLGNGGPEHLLERLREKNLPETETEAG
jgi:phospholipid transport system substrate-binding protein